MLGEPVARVAEILSKAGEIERVLQRFVARRARGYRRQVENGETIGFCCIRGGHASF